METLEKRTIEYDYTESGLGQLMKDFLSEAEQYIKDNDYQLSDESRTAFNQLKHIAWKNYFGNASKRCKKKFIKNVWRFRVKQSLQSLNRLFHFIHTRILAKRDMVKYEWYSYEKWTNPDFIRKVKVLPSQQHLDIQAKRKKWKEARDIAEKLLLEYKEEKGDYYK